MLLMVLSPAGVFVYVYNIILVLVYVYRPD